MTLTSVLKPPAVWVQLQTNMPPVLRFGSASQRPFVLQCPVWLARQLRDWLEPHSEQPPHFPNIHQADDWENPLLKGWRMERMDIHVRLFVPSTSNKPFSLIPKKVLRDTLASLPQ